MRTFIQSGLAAAVLVMATGASASAQVESAYSAVDLDTCRHVRGRDVEDYGVWHCRGYGGIPVRVAAGDQRTFVSYGRKGGDESAAGETLAAFNSIGTTIEGRLRRSREGRRRPFATILRWNTTVSRDDGEAVRGQVLVMTRLAPGAICQIGYVDGRANPDANALARRIAEHAEGFRCGRDKPTVLGQRGPGFSLPPGREP